MLRSITAGPQGCFFSLLIMQKFHIYFGYKTHLEYIYHIIFTRPVAYFFTFLMVSLNEYTHMFLTTIRTYYSSFFFFMASAFCMLLKLPLLTPSILIHYLTYDPHCCWEISQSNSCSFESRSLFFLFFVFGVPL